MSEQHENILMAMQRIEEKLDRIEDTVANAHKETMTRATVAGGVSGSILTVGIALLKAKLGVGG
ncbi:MAG: hypothetical protein IKZ88_04925 [Neisseriaceae bacterium]|nr:hypothetical protein [Neisseriaceae bacterium]